MTYDSSYINILDNCPWCSASYNTAMHNGICPKIRAIEYHPNGQIRRIEFYNLSNEVVY